MRAFGVAWPIGIAGFFFRARSPEPRVAVPGTFHASVHASSTDHSPIAGAVSGRENRPQDHQSSERKRPESQVFTELPQTAFRALGEKEHEIACDRQRGRRNQRQKVDHGCPLNVQCEPGRADARFAAALILLRRAKRVRTMTYSCAGAQAAGTSRRRVISDGAPNRLGMPQ